MYQPQQYVNDGKQEMQNMVQRNLLLKQMAKEGGSSSPGLIILLAVISIVFSGLMFFVGLVTRYFEGVAVGRLFDIEYSGFNIFSYFFTIIFRTAGDSCRSFMAGIVAIPYAAMFFGGFNIIALFLGCCSCTFMTYVQGSVALLTGLLAAYESFYKCSTLGLLLIPYLNDKDHIPDPHNSWSVYAGMAILSLLSAIANHKVKVEADKKREENLSLMISLAK